MALNCTRVLALSLAALVFGSCKPRAETAEVKSDEANHMSSLPTANAPLPNKTLNMGGKQPVTIRFYNFPPSESSREAMELIFAGRAFRPNGLPLDLAKSLNKLRPYVSGGRLGLTSAQDQWLTFGKVPSPPDRKTGIESTEVDYTVGYSIARLGHCVDKESKATMVEVLPLDKYTSASECLKDSKNRPIEREVYTTNCFTCHAGMVAGMVVAGLHPNSIDQSALGEDLSILIGNMDPPTEPKAKSFFKRWLPNITALKSSFANWMLLATPFDKLLMESFFDYHETLILPLFGHSDGRGENYGVYSSYKGMSRLATNGDGFKIIGRKDVAETDDAIYKQNTLPLAPVDPNPWWNLKFKNHVFWTMETKYGTPKDFLYAFTFQHDGIGLHPEEHIGRLSKALEFAKATHSPPYPWPIDWEKVAKGSEIFHTRPINVKGAQRVCADCHGSYDLNEETKGYTVTYPGPLTMVTDVDTDGAYAKTLSLATQGIQGHLNDVAKSMADKHGQDYADKFRPQVTPARDVGVVPPPLVGLWASAPYFHNGSVPTLYEIFRSKRRAPFWSRSLDPTAYDIRHTGLAYDESEAYERSFVAQTPLKAPVDLKAYHKKRDDWSDNFYSPKAAVFRRSYDVTRFGKGNGGHAFMDDWSEEDVYAVIEFLKSVSGPDVLPAGKTAPTTGN